jgi:hypothetical protein
MLDVGYVMEAVGDMIAGRAAMETGVETFLIEGL